MWMEGVAELEFSVSSGRRPPFPSLSSGTRRGPLAESSRTSDSSELVRTTTLSLFSAATCRCCPGLGVASLPYASVDSSDSSISRSSSRYFAFTRSEIPFEDLITSSKICFVSRSFCIAYLS
uniref:Uncharacterized protein n=1 Tax=Tetraselmis sp. GSL018 TaxID=582737 RepID=A0A061RV90_9CHLO